MNRRGFFRALAATAMVAVATQTRVGQVVARVVADPISIGCSYAEALARSILETKMTLSANILDKTFDDGIYSHHT